MPKKIDMFQADTRDLKLLQKFYARAPKMFHDVTAGILNSYAFGTRQENIRILQSQLNIRKPKFVGNSIRVEKANKSASIQDQQAVVGSIKRKGFSGWRENEFGEKYERTRVAQLFARGGDEGKVVRSSLRMRASKSFKSPEDFPGRTAEHRVIIMLSKLKKQKHRKPFVIKRHRKFKKGLYKFFRGRLKMVQDLDPRQRRVKQVRWMRGGVQKFISSAKPREIAADNINRRLKQDSTVRKLKKRR